MRKPLLAFWLLLIAVVLVMPAPSHAAAPVYRCTIYGFELPIPAGWHVLDKVCANNGNVQLFQSDRTTSVMFVLALKPSVHFTSLVNDLWSHEGASKKPLFGTIQARSQTFTTASYTYNDGNDAAYYLGADDAGVPLVFSAYVRDSGTSRGQAELAQVRSTFAAVQFFPRPTTSIIQRVAHALTQSFTWLASSPFAGVVVLTLLFLTGTIMAIIRTQVTSGQMVLGLLLVAVLTTVLEHAAANWLTASLDLAVKLTLVGNLLAWPFLAIATRTNHPTTV